MKPEVLHRPCVGLPVTPGGRSVGVLELWPCGASVGNAEVRRGGVNMGVDTAIGKNYFLY